MVNYILYKFHLAKKRKTAQRSDLTPPYFNMFRDSPKLDSKTHTPGWALTPSCILSHVETLEPGGRASTHPPARCLCPSSVHGTQKEGTQRRLEAQSQLWKQDTGFSIHGTGKTETVGKRPSPASGPRSKVGERGAYNSPCSLCLHPPHAGGLQPPLHTHPTCCSGCPCHPTAPSPRPPASAPWTFNSQCLVSPKVGPGPLTPWHHPLPLSHTYFGFVMNPISSAFKTFLKSDTSLLHLAPFQITCVGQGPVHVPPLLTAPCCPPALLTPCLGPVASSLLLVPQGEQCPTAAFVPPICSRLFQIPTQKLHCTP